MCMCVYTLLKEYFEIIKYTKVEGTSYKQDSNCFQTYFDIEGFWEFRLSWKNTELHLTDIHQDKPLKAELIC